MEKESTNKNQELIKYLLTCDEYLNPKLIAAYCNLGIIGGSMAIRLYIAASIVAQTKHGKDYFERTTRIAKKLNVTKELVRQALQSQRQDKISRAGKNGQRGRRNWIFKGINDQNHI